VFPQCKPNPWHSDEFGFYSHQDEVITLEVEMSEEDLEVLITLDDPGEEELGEDTFHNRHAANTGQPVSTKESA